jgi:molybdopterin converting factor small subunit
MGQQIIALIKWDQKDGGMQEFTYPTFTMRANDCMNIYQMHRVSAGNKAAAIPNFGNLRLRTDSGSYFNCVSFFSGFGGTSPDGFTANYGKETVGVSEKVLVLFIPMEAKSSEYEEILAKLASRILLDVPQMGKRLQTIGALLEKMNYHRNLKESYTYLEKNLDSILGLSPADTLLAWKNEAKALHYMMVDKNEHIKELTLNPAKAAYQQDRQRLDEMNEQKKALQSMIENITKLSTEKAIAEAVGSQKDEMIEQLKADYVKIFGTLTDQIQSLENEIRGISESTQSLVQDLNGILAEKIRYIQELEAQLKMYRNI